MKRCCSIPGILFSVLVLCLPTAWAQDGLHGALSRPGVRQRAFLGLGEQLVAADFDKDNRPDAAILLRDRFLNGQTRFRIELHVTAGRNHAITFLSAERGLTIAAIDVNRDGAPDIVVEREFTHERLQIFLNDGHGHFHKVRSEDYSSPNPSSPWCCGWFRQSMPLSYLPATCGLELPGSRCLATVDPSRAKLLNSYGDVLRSMFGARSRSTPRAPPSWFAL